MSYEKLDEYIFQQVNEGVLLRKCYGLEELVSNMEEYCDGLAHVTVTAAVSFQSFMTRKALEEQAKAAWIALRHFTPVVACKAIRLSDGDRRFALRYTVPRSHEDVQEWLDATVFFSDNSKDTPLYEKHRELKDGHWWRSSEDHYVLELHISPMGDDWAFSLVFSHNVMDGRNSYAMLDIFLGLLAREMENKLSTSPIAIEWGMEVGRLPPPGAVAAALVEGKLLPTAKNLGSEDTTNGTNELERSYWLYGTPQTNQTGDVSHLVQFSEETTAKLRGLCRKKGRTITQVITALSMLAHAESALKAALEAGKERFQEVSSSYNSASHYHIPVNAVNHRHKLPGGYDSYHSPTSAPLCAADSVPLSFPMDGIRSCVKFDEANNTVVRVVDDVVFWDDLVRDVASTWKEADQSLVGYAEREAELHRLYDAFQPEAFNIPALVVSSIGDLGRLGWLSSFLPAQENGPSPQLVVNDVISGVRIRTALVMNTLWEYNGKISCHFMTGGEYTTTENLNSMTRVFEEWTHKLFH